MSHPLGPLADNLTAYAIYATAQTEMRHAYALIRLGDFASAAAEIESAAHRAEVLAHATEGLDASRSEHWLRVVAARRRFAEHARSRAAVTSAREVS
ncbi:hypothetical protein [Amycolatopsis sp.]|jgi:hypothetical protein|uniref:hypothetical protein n=1 Tax=Amycolatopsis sp. TaxID=37632 RepID=UPI002DFEA4C0|nr:hypothetical protein [Amycolatopsis sp.]